MRNEWDEDMVSSDDFDEMNEGVMCYVVMILLLFVGCYVSFVNNFWVVILL